MTRWALIVDADDGPEVVIFANQREADAWEDAHPGIGDFVVGGMPVTTRTAVKRATRQYRQDDTGTASRSTMVVRDHTDPPESEPSSREDHHRHRRQRQP